MSKYAGIDPSSAKTGFALAVDGKLEQPILWKPKGTLKGKDKMLVFEDWITAVLTFTQPDGVVIEECAPQRNAKVFRVLVRYECIAQMAAHRLGIPVYMELGSSATRAIVFGDGKTGKTTAHSEIVRRYPEFDWLPEEKGGDDQTDAAAMALAAPDLFRRL